MSHGKHAISQVNVKGLSNAQKAKIAPIHRLEATPTTAESRLLEFLVKGPEAMDDPAYWDAVRAVEQEREEADAS